MTTGEYYVGIMSGTSLDGIDVALVENNQGQFTLIGHHFSPYEAQLKSELIALHTPAIHELEQAYQMANTLSRQYAEAVQTLLNITGFSPDAIRAIGCHGQTIRHCPRDGYTVQLGNAALLAELTHITVVSDFRSRDIAAGGQGAPLVPAFHLAVFGDSSKNRAIINIGGIANITFIDKCGKVLGFDTGPGNMLLDYWTQLHLGQPYDKNGAWAATGDVLPDLLESLLSDSFFRLPPPKSTGRDLFNASWLHRHLEHRDSNAKDIARTLVELTVITLFDALNNHCKDLEEVYLCGGGAHNTLIRTSLSQKLERIPVGLTDDLGIAADWVEAAAFAWLANQTLNQQPGNLPLATGASGHRILGAIYPA